MWNTAGGVTEYTILEPGNPKLGGGRWLGCVVALTNRVVAGANTGGCNGGGRVMALYNGGGGHFGVMNMGLPVKFAAGLLLLT